MLVMQSVECTYIIIPIGEQYRPFGEQYRPFGERYRPFGER